MLPSMQPGVYSPGDFSITNKTNKQTNNLTLGMNGCNTWVILGNIYKRLK